MRMNGYNYEECIREHPLSGLVRSVLRDVTDQMDFEDDHVKRQYETAVMNNVYLSDYNEIRTLDELNNRINTTYSLMYYPYLKSAFVDDPEHEAKVLDTVVRSSLTILALIYCTVGNQFEYLENVLLHSVYTISDDDKRYHGCIVVTKSGYMIETIKKRITSGDNEIYGDLPPYVIMEMDACIGNPHFTGMYKDIGTMNEPIIEEEDWDGYSGNFDNAATVVPPPIYASEE